MPSRNRAREQAKADQGAKPAKRRRAKKPKKTGPKGRPDPSDVPDAETRFIAASDATKTYICPGCNRDIPPGVGHLVAVPPNAPDLRRHWHRACWNKRTVVRR